MKTIQIQVPEGLFAKIKALAHRRGWSVDETFRRGAELLLETYAEDGVPVSQPWQPPTSRRLGWKGLSDAEVKAEAQLTSTENSLVRRRKSMNVCFMYATYVLTACDSLIFSCP